LIGCRSGSASSKWGPQGERGSCFQGRAGCLSWVVWEVRGTEGPPHWLCVQLQWRHHLEIDLTAWHHLWFCQFAERLRQHWVGAVRRAAHLQGLLEVAKVGGEQERVAALGRHDHARLPSLPHLGGAGRFPSLQRMWKLPWPHAGWLKWGLPLGVVGLAKEELALECQSAFRPHCWLQP